MKLITTRQRSIQRLTSQKQKRWRMGYSNHSPMGQSENVPAMRPRFASAASRVRTQEKTDSKSHSIEEYKPTRAQKMLMMAVPKETPQKVETSPTPRVDVLRKRVQEKKLKTDEPTASQNLTKPDVCDVIGFIMQAEELAQGKHQTKVVADIAQQFGDLMYYVERLETQRDNLKTAFDALLKTTRINAKDKVDAVNNNDPYSCGEYW